MFNCTSCIRIKKRGEAAQKDWKLGERLSKQAKDSDSRYLVS